MKTCFPTCSFIALLVITLFGVPFHAYAQSPPPLIPLRLEVRTNGTTLTVGSLSQTGALFLQMAADLQTLLTNPTPLFQTNTPLANDLRLPSPPVNGVSTQAFFSATYYPGQSVDEFGDPESSSPEPVPDMLLFTSDLPPNLGGGQPFIADFLVTDPAGQPASISGTATILVVRESDGAAHPDASATPVSAQLTNGYMRVTIVVNATTSLDGYTLGLSIAPGAQGLLHPHVSSTFLKAAFGLGPMPLTPPQRTYWTQQLEQRRLNNADLGPSWSNPMPGFQWSVSGTFGEWRGDNDTRSHYGVDLGTANTTAINVKASRGGVVSKLGVVSTTPMGNYVVIDHGCGFFSGYWHLAASSIVVKEGQIVARGDTLATSLFARTPAQVNAYGRWGTHLHFEIRTNATSAWGDGKPGGAENTSTGPGTAQDPLATSGVFSVPPKNNLPKLKSIGVTQQHPGQTVFNKAGPIVSGNGTVYLLAQFIGPKAGRTLGLRALRFQPEGSSFREIRPSNNVAIASYLPFSTGGQKGFARYKLTSNKADQMDWFRYWWQWDTSSYANARKGPRTFSLTGEDYGGSTTNYTFTFGPQVKGSLIVPGPLGGQQFMFTNVAYLGTNLLADPSQPDPNFSQPDQYQLQIIQANGQPLPGVTWWEDGTQLAANYSSVFDVHMDEAVYTFTLPDGQSAQGLKLRVSSLLVPNIAHEVQLNECSPPSGVTPVANMVWIQYGTFVMGSPASEAERGDDETQHTVTLTKGFYMGKYAVTQGEYLALMGNNPSSVIKVDARGNPISPDLRRPVEEVSWDDATAYCAQLTAQEQAAGRLPACWVYRLPTESEREYACRAGTTTAFNFGSAIHGGMANFYDYSEYDASIGVISVFDPAVPWLARSTTVGSYQPNAWGLYDMHGNVWEWCRDRYGAYPTGSVIDPQGPASGPFRVARGGSWGAYDGSFCRSACRDAGFPSGGGESLGFRVVLAPGQP
jgi:sulfatase modifying factor 1